MGRAGRLAAADDAPAPRGLLQRDAHRARSRRDDGAREGKGRLRARAHAHEPGAADERRGPCRAAHGDSRARREAVGDSRSAGDALDAARVRRRRQDGGRDGAAGSRDDHRRAAQRDRLRQPAPGRAVRPRLSETTERARADAARVVRRAAVRHGRSRVRCGAGPVDIPLPLRSAPPRVEDPAAEPSARQHLRLQHRRGARGEHDALRARDAGRRRGRGHRARCHRRLGTRPIPARCDPRRRGQHQCVRTRAGRRGVHRSAGRQRGAVADRRHAGARSAGHVLADRVDDHRGHRTGRTRRRVPDSRRGTARHACHEPLRNAVGAERPPRACSVVGTCAPAVRVRGLRFDHRSGGSVGRGRPPPRERRRTVRGERTAQDLGGR